MSNNTDSVKENPPYEVAGEENWENCYCPEAEKLFKKSKPDVYYDTMARKFYPQIQKLFNEDMGDKFEAIDPDDKDATVIVTSINPEGKEVTEPTEHPFVLFAKTEGQKRGGFELAFIAREKSSGDVTQALAYFSPPHIGKIDVSWETKGDPSRYTWTV
jgi:hypothetical protein